jgi:hypothetical protein
VFTERVKLLDGLRAPPGGMVTPAWMEQLKTVLVQTFGDCNAPLTHRGQVTIDRSDTVTDAVRGNRPRPIQPYPYSSIDPSNTDKPSETASFTAHGGDSYLNLDNGTVNNGLNAYFDGANFIEQVVVGDLVVLNNAIFEGGCEGCSGGEGGEPGEDLVGAEPVRFMLTSRLSRNGYATATFYSVVGGVEVAIGIGQVGSWSGQYYGEPGARGWAVLKGDSKNDNGTVGLTHHVLWLDNWPMRVILQGDLSLGGSCLAKQIVGPLDEPVGDQITVQDSLGNKRARDGAKGVVVHFQDRPGEFLLVDVQTDADWIVVTALQDGGGASLTGELVRSARGRPPKAVGETLLVYDPDGQFGFVKTGAKLRCELNDNTGEYHIAQATVDVLVQTGTRYNETDHKYEITTRLITVWAADDEGDWEEIEGTPDMVAVEVMTDWQIDGFDYEGKFRTIYVQEADDEGDWVVLETGEEC